jgi:hypothetical protein
MNATRSMASLDIADLGLLLDRPARRQAVFFLLFAAGSAGDHGSRLPICCLINLASRVTRVKDI